MGYYVVDRQLEMIGTDGQKYGTGSLINVFNQTALGKLTSYSTTYNSETLKEASLGDTYTATGLYQNGYGN